MSVREYIGARYIPIYLGNWNIENAYEPLSVVLYEGASYTSRQYVPSGIAITNTDYWLQSGNYNAQVEQYRQEVLAYVQSVSAIVPFDTAPTQDSTKGVTSGGVYDAITELSNAIDKINLQLENINTLINGSTYGDIKNNGFVYNQKESE